MAPQYLVFTPFKRWYDVPYRLIPFILQLAAVYSAYLTYQTIRSSDEKLQTHEARHALSLQTFGVSDEQLDTSRWTCNTTHLRTGLPRARVDATTFQYKGHNDTMKPSSAIKFPWLPIRTHEDDDSDTQATNRSKLYDAMHTFETCAKQWFRKIQNRIICASSYTLGASTNALILRINGAVSVAWEPVLVPLSNASSSLEIHDLANKSIRSRIEAPRTIAMSYFTLSEGQLKRIVNGTVLREFDAHCAWTYAGHWPL